MPEEFLRGLFFDDAADGVLFFGITRFLCFDMVREPTIVHHFTLGKLLYACGPKPPLGIQLAEGTQGVLCEDTPMISLWRFDMFWSFFYNL